jgi:deazaflavin-dependent oxidoreductase (nitroreductase family)
MATTITVPRFVRVANVMTKTLLRSGVKLTGFGRHPTYLITVRGRKSGEPRSTPISVIEQHGNRYVLAPYGVVDWVRNLRAAGMAILTRGRQTEEIRAVELPSGDAVIVLKEFIASKNPMGHFFGVTPESTPEEFAHAAASHPVFRLEHPSVAPSQ